MSFQPSRREHGVTAAGKVTRSSTWSSIDSAACNAAVHTTLDIHCDTRPFQCSNSIPGMDDSESHSLLPNSHRTEPPASSSTSYLGAARKQVRRFLSSKYGHYSVLLLVSLDVSCIFADFLISLYICEHSYGKNQNVGKELPEAQDILGVVSLLFSCLFMVELLASVWAFGFP